MRDFNDVVEEIKFKSDIYQIISNYINLKPSGSGYVGLCPFHNEKTPSFSVNTDKQIYKCFGCGAAGDVINFIMNIENLDFKEALALLGKELGINTEIYQSNYKKNDYEDYQRYLDIHKEAGRFFYFNLRKVENRAYEYLMNRGIDDHILNKFGIGFALDNWSTLYEYLLNKGYETDDLLKTGLFSESKSARIYDKFRNRIMFPIFDYKGNVIGFGGRVMDDKMPKYLNSPETEFFNKRNNLYGLNFARKEIKNRTLILVEGYMDLISLYQYGFGNTVATLGTALTKNQALLIKKYADHVHICYDADRAGQSASLRAIELLVSVGISPNIIRLKGAKDPDEYLKKFGAERFKYAIDKSDYYLKFIVDNLAERYKLDDNTQKVDFIRKAGQEISKYASPVEKELYLSYISEYVGVDKNAVEKEVIKNNTDQGNFLSITNIKGKNKEKEKKTDNLKKPKRLSSNEKPVVKLKVYNSGELELVKLMTLDLNLRKEIIINTESDYFKSDDSKKLFDYIVNNPDMGINKIEEIQDLDLSGDFVTAFNNYKADAQSIDSFRIKEINKFLKKSHIEGEIMDYSEIQAKLENELKLAHDSDKKGIEDRLMKIVFKIIELNKELKNI